MCPQLSPSKSVISLNAVSPSLMPADTKKHPTFSFEQASEKYGKSQCSPCLPLEQDITDYSQIRQSVENQYKMRTDSIIKGYQMKITRQNQTHQLKQLKYEEQIQYLKRQIKQLCAINQQNKLNYKQSYHCSLCSNGEIIKFMRNMQDALQSDHSACLTEKKQLNIQLQSVSQKLSVVENQLQESERRYQKMKIEYKQLKSEKQAWQRQKRDKQRQFREVQRNFQVKQMQFQQNYAKHQIMQKQLETQIKKAQAKHFQDVSKIKDQYYRSSLLKQQQQQLRNIMQSNRNFKQSRKQITRQLSKHHHRNILQNDPQIYSKTRQMANISPMNMIPEVKVGLDISSIMHKPSLSRLPLKNSTHLTLNRTNTTNNWNQKGNTIIDYKPQQSYTDYANERRKARKLDAARSGIFNESRESFDTFRRR